MADFKNQHFLQQAYLEGFAASNLPAKWSNVPATWVLHKKTGTIRLKSIRKTAVRTHYYSFVDKNGKMNPLIERWFNPIENEFIRLRQHIRDHIAEVNLTGKASNLNPEYRRLLAEYVYVHMIRVPSLLDEIKSKAKAFETETSTRHGLPYDENHAQVLALRTMIRVGNTPGLNIMDAFMKRTLDIEFFPRTRVSLATSDAPIVMYDVSRPPGLAYESTTVFFPLESSVMLRFSEFGDHIRLLKQRDSAAAVALQRLMASKAHGEIYCGQLEVLIRIAEYLGIEGKIREPFGMEKYT